MGREVKRDRLEVDVVESISDRLSKLPDLHLPYAMRCRVEPVSKSEIKAVLVDLLLRDAAVFLERYGSQLKSEELEEFEVLKHDYEISWHLKHLKSVLTPTIEERRLQAVVAKNRRLAYMDRLIHDGQYFSEDAMRARAPFLHHEYVGKFQDPTTRGISRPGERWSETLMRQSEEAIILTQIREEQERLGIREDENMEEEEEEEDDSSSDEVCLMFSNELHKDDQHANNEVKGVVEDALFERGNSNQVENLASQTVQSDADHSKQKLSHEELQVQMGHFTRIMQEKFLSGEDTEHVDYANIDNNVTLDDHWLREITYDAEEKYFEED
eukprot:Gb_15132 [translate_table: standard]